MIWKSRMRMRRTPLRPSAFTLAERVWGEGGASAAFARLARIAARFCCRYSRNVLTFVSFPARVGNLRCRLDGGRARHAVPLQTGWLEVTHRYSSTPRLTRPQDAQMARSAVRLH